MSLQIGKRQPSTDAEITSWGMDDARSPALDQRGEGTASSQGHFLNISEYILLLSEGGPIHARIAEHGNVEPRRAGS